MRPVAEVQAEVRACRLCFPEGGNRPVAAGPADAVAMVIGQAPSLTDSQSGRAFSGPGGKRLREWFARAGLPERDVYLSALTKCYPGPSASGKGDRAPSRQEVLNCRPHLLGEVEALQPRIVLLVGGMAIREFLGRGPLSDHVGMAFRASEHEPFATLLAGPEHRWIVPLPHCSGASLWLNRPEHRALLDRALGLIASMRTHDTAND